MNKQRKLKRKEGDIKMEREECRGEIDENKTTTPVYTVLRNAALHLL
jgi:hypothetical protein